MDCLHGNERKFASFLLTGSALVILLLLYIVLPVLPLTVTVSAKTLHVRMQILAYFLKLEIS